MKLKPIILAFVLTAGLVFFLPSCGSSGKSSGGGSSSGGGGTGTGGTGTGTGGTGTGGNGGAGSGGPNPSVRFGDEVDNWARYRHIWVDPKDGFDYLIYLRELYASHGRNPGPDQTWPISFGWSDALAGDAQAEAERLAAGGSQKGTPYASMSERAFYLDGINTSKYTYSGLEKPSDWCERNGGWEHHENPIFPFTNCNTMFRLYFCYHDPGGAGPVLTKMGVGMAMSGEDRWWVFVLGP